MKKLLLASGMLYLYFDEADLPTFMTMAELAAAVTPPRNEMKP